VGFLFHPSKNRIFKDMNVNMDGLRRRLIHDYNFLTRKLNASIKDKSWDPEIIVDPNYIKKEMDGLRDAIVTLAFCYMEGQDGFQELPEDTQFEIFFPEEGE
jgi:hypothetical protein